MNKDETFLLGLVLLLIWELIIIIALRKYFSCMESRRRRDVEAHTRKIISMRKPYEEPLYLRRAFYRNPKLNFSAQSQQQVREEPV